MENSNVDLIKCEECGSEDFELVDIVNISAFYKEEYSRLEGFKRKVPGVYSSKKKMFCSNCGIFFREQKKHATLLEIKEVI